MFHLNQALVPGTFLPARPLARAAERQRHARLGAAFSAQPTQANARSPSIESRLVVVVEPDETLRRLVQLILGEIAQVVGSRTSEDTRTTMRECGGDVVRVSADMHLAGSISSLALARTVIERWPGTHTVLSSDAADLTRRTPSRIG